MSVKDLFPSKDSNEFGKSDFNIDDLLAAIHRELNPTAPEVEPLRVASPSGEQAIMTYNGDTKIFSATTLDSTPLSVSDKAYQTVRSVLQKNGFTVLYAESATLQISVDMALQLGPLMGLMSLMKGTI